jgi:hypothetical protein
LAEDVSGINIPKLNELQKSKNLGVDNSEFVIDGLIENHVVDETVDLLSVSSQPLNSVSIDIL